MNKFLITSKPELKDKDMEVNKIYKGDAELTLMTFRDNVFHSHVSDPPYGLNFMGKHWDYDVPPVSTFKEMFRTLKPGGYILIACGTRTQHRMACNIEDAGFEIRDVISWLYGSGFPKSLDVSKAIDKKFGAEREDTGEIKLRHGGGKHSKNIGQLNPHIRETNITAPSTDEAKKWEGYGTALKPAQEFWTLARKPISEKTVAENVLKHGTGGINIDICRIGDTGARNNGCKANDEGYACNDIYGKYRATEKVDYNKGRFPSNVILDEFMGKELDKMTGVLKSGAMKKPYEYQNNGFSLGKPTGSTKQLHDSNEGGASRFFYCAKASKNERNIGLEDFYWRVDKSVQYGFVRIDKIEYDSLPDPMRTKGNIHPTVKPISLMRYMVRLITPKGGLTCDPFCGSGTTPIGAKLEHINYVAIEREQENVDISEARVAAWNPEKYKEQELF